MTIGLLGNTRKPNLRAVAVQILKFLGKRKADVVVEAQLAAILPKGTVNASAVSEEAKIPARCDLLIALGGDGTMLSAARLIGESGVPILGVNLGKLGFLAEVSLGEWEEFLPEVVAGRYRVEERMCLMTTVRTKPGSFISLNEVVIDRGSSARVIELETWVDDEYLVTYSADGIIVATPTGSTAYSLASGGPIVDPRSGVMMINPISPHSLTSRAVVLPPQSTVRVVVHAGTPQVHLTSDGQIESFIDTPAEFIVKKAPHSIKLVKRADPTYFDTLRRKLFWGKDIRTEHTAQ